MSGRLVVKRYARALYEAAEESAVLDDVVSDIEFMDGLMEEEQIRGYCLRGNLSRENIREFTDTAFKPYISGLSFRLLESLCDNGRLSALPFLPEAFRDQADHASGTAVLTIETAEELSPDLADEITKRISKRAGVSIRSEIKLNRALSGGISLTWLNRNIDMSLRGRLRKMRTLLKQQS